MNPATENTQTSRKPEKHRGLAPVPSLGRLGDKMRPNYVEASIIEEPGEQN